MGSDVGGNAGRPRVAVWHVDELEKRFVENDAGPTLIEVRVPLKRR